VPSAACQLGKPPPWRRPARGRDQGCGVRLASGQVRRISFDDWPGCAPESATYLAITQWSNPVASVCDVCGKGPGFGNNVSHSHRRTPRRWNPNIQRVRAMVGKTPRRLNVCTSCIKAGKVTR
jgi:large subunit ribosomal protein L28